MRCGKHSHARCGYMLPLSCKCVCVCVYVLSSQVVRDYNKILTTLDKEERRLFADRIRHLDR